MVSIWFTFGGCFSLIAYLLGANFKVQVIVFFISSIMFFLVFKPLTKKYMRSKVEPTNCDRYIGKRYHLIKGITEEKSGEIKINDLIWYVVSNDGCDIEAGSLVEILAFEGSKAIVRKVN